VKAICLSAGRSSRLLPLTREVHKSALQVASWPVLDWQMSAFVQAGIKEVVLVLGHGAHAIRRLLEPWHSVLKVHVVENTEFDCKNLDFSLFCAREFLDGPTLYYEGDLLLHPRLITSLCKSTSDITIAAGSHVNTGWADMVVQRRSSGYFLECAEHGALSISGSQGEFVCAVHFSATSIVELRSKLMSSVFSGPMRLYELFSALMQSYSTTLVDASGDPWIEIDGAADFERAPDIVRKFGFEPSYYLDGLGLQFDRVRTSSTA
jgi:L-glutamine-phosphate cytidylyltransferase